ncbi:S1C family serine protease [Clostridium hydrogenum]|uniref:S1C family serine protease n=1 Tax=Clostridium hydrogenum TaxID=2855764 RepID=UPI001F1DFD5A|nr:trypsin-like peptidase domain-containing protein [Clostridium hydrogenum]
MDNFNNNNFNNDNNNDTNSNLNIPAQYTVEDDFTPPMKPKRKNKFASYIVVGLVCSIVGASASTAASLYVLPKSGLFKNTPLYQSLAQNYTSATQDTTIKATATSTVSSTSGALTGAQIAKKVGPAVVGVSTKAMVDSSQNSDPYSFYGNSGSTEQDGMGSGIIINAQGYILTNYHVISDVVSGSGSINVIFNNKKQVAAKVVNYDANMDLAVIKITDNNVKVPGIAELGSSSNMNVGDPVYAIGNPLGEELLGSVTSGIISATNRQISTDENSNAKQTYIQTDAAINPGNSGGALVNSLGQVIGINSAKIGSSNSSSTSVEGIGFAIPIDLVKPKIASLTKPLLMLGIKIEDYPASELKAHGLPAGVYVAQVDDFSAAQKAGIQAGDIITKFNGKKVTNSTELNTAKSALSSGDVVKVEVYRDDGTKTLSLKLTD